MDGALPDNVNRLSRVINYWALAQKARNRKYPARTQAAAPETGLSAYRPTG